MPKSRWGAGRACLVVGADGVVGAVSGALAGAGFAPRRVATEEEALAELEAGPFAAVLASQKLGPIAVAGIVARAGQRNPLVPTVVIGATGSVQEAVDAMQLGAADYLVGSVEEPALLQRLRRVLERNAQAPPAAAGAAMDFMGLVGTSAALRKLLGTIDRISRYKANVLLLGESGTGKELIARALHARGPRHGNLFVPVNCATLGHDILENELFGHERGAFTGANDRKKGLFELADGGTLFLDEIAEMDPSTQAKLLRVLERNEFRRVGGTTKVKVDASVIAATHRNLEESIRAGKFREDLYYRLKVVTIVVPPLRDRKEDIPSLIDAFIADFNRRYGGKIQGIAPQALKILMEYDWPGNVREIKNAVESAAVLATGETIGPDGFSDLLARSTARNATSAPPPSLAPAPGTISIALGTPLAEVERQIILATLRQSGSRSTAAKMLGIGLRTLYTRLREYSAN
jgi:DNA-binding NtrC family response regulator